MAGAGSATPHPASFRDPSGFIFWKNGTLYRQINTSYQATYEAATQAGLYSELIEAGLLIPHTEAPLKTVTDPQAVAVLQPEEIPFVSYPYEWCFSQLRDAALATLEIQRRALAKGFSLKDASAYNIQFHHGKPLLIDTLSFEQYEKGAPWVAYQQFCQHFLAPLALMRHTNQDLNKLLRVYIGGIPLSLASSLLSSRTRLNFSLLSHLHLHARQQQQLSDKPIAKKQHHLSPFALEALLDSLQNAVKALRPKQSKTEWGEYYDNTNYTDSSLAAKAKIVEKYLQAAKPKTVWDLGANNGYFSRLASQHNILTIAFDIDPVAVEKNYHSLKGADRLYQLPLILDLTNPSPALGWAHKERLSLQERGPADVVMALALIHHLAISNNLPFDRIAEYFAALGKSLIIEFVPKEDSKVQRLLHTREDIFPRYTEAGFEKSFGQYFTLKEKTSVPGSKRTLYYLVRK